MNNNKNANSKELVIKEGKNIVDAVASRIKALQNSGDIRFPANYSPENALKAAWLILQETVDKDKRPALEVCSKESIANSLLKMVIQGLDPLKNQCYFVVYGNKLVLQRSYFGSIHVAKSVNPNLEDIYYNVVYEGDEFEFEYKQGRTIITKHKSNIKNIQKDKIVAAYAVAVFKDGREEAVVMTIDEIKQAWMQSPTKPVDDKGNIKSGTTHEKFTAEMCKKTVVNRLCKKIINTSDDSNLVVKAAKETEAETIEYEVEEEIQQNANKETIDIAPEEFEVLDAEEESKEEVPFEKEEGDKGEKTAEDGPDF